ncbi:MAG: hypothetical protein PHW66_06645 [Gallionella sp.]|nr:hypothetical protein [Gallionella sp.]
MFYIAHELFYFTAGKFDIGQSDELRPAEAERAIGMASLSLAGKEQYCLPIFVLHAVQRFTFENRHIVVSLPRGMGIELHTNPVCSRLDHRLLRAVLQKLRHFIVMFPAKHFLLRKGECKDRIVGGLVPIDELLDDVIICLEWKDVTDNFNVELLLFG